MTSALEVFLNDMRYINPRFILLLTYLYLLTVHQTDLFHIYSTVNLITLVCDLLIDSRTDPACIHRAQGCSA